jgi:putative Mn2+ efflux pump MntP
MEIITIILVAIGLCFDSFAVSVSIGIFRNDIRFKEALGIAFWLALFQGVMPLIGWLAGVPLREILSEVDHWIAFGLLAFIGIKMIVDALKSDGAKRITRLNLWIVWGLALATSLDALAVGFTFALTEMPVLIAGLIIALITGLAAMLGMLSGKNIPAKNLKWIEIAGGVILIAIGAKILISHMNWL